MWNRLRQWKWKYIVPGVLAVLVILGTIAGRRFFVLNEVDDYNDASGEWAELEASTVPAEQSILLRKDVCKIHVLMSSISGDSATLVAELVDRDGNVLSSTQAQITNTGGNPTAVILNMPTTGVTEPTEVTLRTSLTQDVDGVNYCVQKGAYEESFLYQNQSVESRMRMSVNYGGRLNVTALLLFLLAALSVIALFVLPKRLAKTENYFVILAVSFGLFFAFVNPPVQECDGITHLVRSFDVSYGNVLAPLKNITHEKKEVILPADFSEAQWTVVDPAAQDAVAYRNRLQNMHFSKETVTVIYPGSIPAFAYYPQAFGLKLGRMLNLSVYMCVVLSRIFNLFNYIAITYFAIRFMPAFKNLMTAVALMPLALYQAASDSPDAVLNALCFLFISLCCYYAFDDKKPLTWKHTFVLGWILAGLFTIKYVYVFLGLLVFMIPKKRFESKRAYWIAFGIALLPLAVLGGVQWMNITRGVNYMVEMGAGGAGITQTQYLKLHPLHIVKVYAKTMFFMSEWFIESMYIFGWLNCSLGLLTYAGPCFIALVGLLDVKEANLLKTKMSSRRNRILMLAAFGMVFALVLFGLYIADSVANPVGADIILGVQGRYFIALLPLVFMALHSSKVKNEIEHFALKVSGIAGVMLLYASLILQNAYY